MDEKFEPFLQSLEQLANDQDKATPAISAVSVMFEKIAGAVAWQVAVVSPGFLGLLWNARALASSSRLSADVFTVVFITAELSFLTGIISAVLVHNDLLDKSITGSLRALAIQGLKHTVDVARIQDAPTKKMIEGFKELLDSHDEALAKFRVVPWYVQLAGKTHGWVTLLGYALVGLIIVTLRL